MPLSSSIDKARRLVISLGSGILTAIELRDAQVLVRTDPAFDPTYAQLFDVRAVTRLAFTTEDVIAQARTTPMAPGVRRAFVVSSVEQVGLARMFQSYIGADDDTLRIFEHPDDALQWLVGPVSESGTPKTMKARLLPYAVGLYPSLTGDWYPVVGQNDVMIRLDIGEGKSLAVFLGHVEVRSGN